jgi:hypothetical protein
MLASARLGSGPPDGEALVLADLDDTIKRLLVRDVPIDLGEVEVSFDAPDREWSGRLSRPAINCFLYDVRENVELRRTGWEVEKNNGSGTASRRRPPFRIDFTFQVTTWARAAEDEHNLLWRVLVALLRNPVLPEELLEGGLAEQPFSIPCRTVLPELIRTQPADLWQAVDNRIRPALTNVVTLAVDPNLVFVDPLVFTRVLRVREPFSTAIAVTTYLLSGRVRDRTDPARGIPGALVEIEESGVELVTDEDGRFSFRRTVPGAITLTARAPGRPDIAQKFEVPSPSYDLEV